MADIKTLITEISQPLNLVYRLDSNPVVPETIVSANGPLTMEQIDGNMKAISNRFEKINDIFDQVDIVLQDKANAVNPEFSGSLRIPMVASTTGLGASEGTIVYSVESRGLELRIFKKLPNGTTEGKWHRISTDTGLNGFLSTKGGIVTGQVKFERDIVVYNGISTIAPDASVTNNLEIDHVATANWTIDRIRDEIGSRLGSSSNVVTVDHVSADTITLRGDEEDPSTISIEKGNVELKGNGSITIYDGNKIGGKITVGILEGNIDLGELDSYLPPLQ